MTINIYIVQNVSFNIHYFFMIFFSTISVFLDVYPLNNFYT